MSSHSLTNSEIQKFFYQNKPKFNGVYPGDNLPKIKDGKYVINLDKYELIGTHWIALHVNGNKIIHFDSLWVEHITKETKIFIGNKMEQQIFIEYKHTVQQCLDTFVLDLLILC